MTEWTVVEDFLDKVYKGEPFINHIAWSCNNTVCELYIGEYDRITVQIGDKPDNFDIQFRVSPSTSWQSWNSHWLSPNDWSKLESYISLMYQSGCFMA